MSSSDPTDHALAAIASILDLPEAHRMPEPAPVEEEKPLAPAHVEPAAVEPAAVEPAAAEPAAAEPAVIEPAAVELAPIEPAVIVPNGYSKTGPGPMAAIRFKWTVREDNGAYYVDETIGENSYPIALGPMSAEAAIKLVDGRESDAHRQFEALKGDMAGRRTAVHPIRGDSGEM